jgi:transcription initiation factor IIE alpha subunit
MEQRITLPKRGLWQEQEYCCRLQWSRCEVRKGLDRLYEAVDTARFEENYTLYRREATGTIVRAPLDRGGLH